MTILECILDWAKTAGIEANPYNNSILFPAEGENGRWAARLTAIEEDDMLFIVTAYPFPIAEHLRIDAALALADITSRLKAGAFYADQEDGQINFRIGQKICKGEERAAWVEEWISTAMTVTDSYYAKMKELADFEEPEFEEPSDEEPKFEF